MARVHVVQAGSGRALPEALELLAHSIVRHQPELSWDEQEESDLVLLDARSDLGAARRLAGECALVGLPMLLLVDAAGLAVITRDWGAGDFVLDKATPAELDARIRLLLTRAGDDDIISSGPLVIDESAYTVQMGGQPLDLTYTEFELLKYLALHPGRVLSREQLLSEVWGYDYYGGTRTVDVHIRRLRAKLGTEYEAHIGTVRNVGYRFQPNR